LESKRVATSLKVDASSGHGEGSKRLRHPTMGLIALEYSGFAVDGRPDLGMVIYNPATAEDSDKIRALLKGNG
jgi:hypothetical protein